jgi:carbon monoxide dehydrogenase subunit G
MTFGATVRQEEADAAAKRLRLVADARELRGRGMARATVAAAVHSEDGGSRVEIATDLDLSGAVAQYGRGIVKDLAAQLTAEFADNLRARLESDSPEPVATRPVSGFRLLFKALLGRLRWRS